jgi:hypothetical protein
MLLIVGCIVLKMFVKCLQLQIKQSCFTKQHRLDAPRCSSKLSVPPTIRWHKRLNQNMNLYNVYPNILFILILPSNVTQSLQLNVAKQTNQHAKVHPRFPGLSQY